MKYFKCLSICMILLGLSVPMVWAQAKDQKPVKVLTGEQLYAINCSRCHTERYPTERTSAQWKTILMHMRVRANIPADQAKKILKYLQENN
ncbi:MAG: hypothetical protein KGK03_00850 [Candidatus Omnitrophica bacterium]|nr:hypothetical protein [Candidatus Omnitrophota bacterium]MDE2221603.1 hypothetical protein [Candidatus Omnitrophota bacterium]